MEGESKLHAIIPAAGYATRLYPLTLDMPKHLLEVKGKPVIEHVIEKIRETGTGKIFIVSNEKYYRNFIDWAKNFNSKSKAAGPVVRVLNDGTTSNEDRIGQIGDIIFGIEQARINDDLLIVAGDNLFNFSLKPCLDFFTEKKMPVNALWDCSSTETAKQLGVVSINGNGKLSAFWEKPGNPKTTLVSLGIYFFPKKSIKLFKQYIFQKNNPDKMGYFMEWLIKNSEAYGYVYKEKWFDIGWRESLEQARKEFNPGKQGEIK